MRYKIFGRRTGLRVSELAWGGKPELLEVPVIPAA
jgi:hypothetical protein